MSSVTRPHIEAMEPVVRLSQCMIVKNEEANIERALSWARDIAFEQIVVDTGSTDKTAEIAEKLGARVYHFEWIDDFAAAKNYAIEQAGGDWIAFLDADEFLSARDAEKLMKLLCEIEKNRDSLRIQAITNSWVQLDDSGEAYAVYQINRVFKNEASIRYEGRIHERLSLTKGAIEAPDICVMHTGYTKSAGDTTGKTQRNIKMLRRELDSDPDNAEIMIYLADSIKSTELAEDNAEAAELYNAALNSGKPINRQIKRLAYDFLIKYYLEIDRIADAEKLCSAALEEYPEYKIDYLYYDAVLANIRGDYKKAWDSLIRCEKLLEDTAVPQTRFLLTNRLPLLFQKILAAQGLGDYESIVKFATLILKQEKESKEILEPYIAMLKQNNASDSELIGLLQKLYDFSDVKDKLFLVRAAKDAGAISLAQTILSMITEEERRWLSGGG